ncbi:hypothetical protein [Chachezhania sediminis]|uniref:hypothetical protein n=1 Tax=Chachezhania sediminis TaxID=2599291 RepID=UPI00131E2BDE|nr:hypothetical protein [Chachezhania sediminis]
MQTLQRFLLPDPAICTEEALYYHAKGPCGWDTGSATLTMGPGASIGFGSYFNLFALGKWASACTLDGLVLEVEGEGLVQLRVSRAIPDRSWAILTSQVVTLVPGTVHGIDLGALLDGDEDGEAPRGVLCLDITNLGDSARFTGGRFATRAEPESWPALTVSITTFKREVQVRDTVARLEDFLAGYDHGDRIAVQVVDNGQSAGIEPSAHVRPMPNRNLGGAGGFARGLLEAQASGATHCLFMDDDASFHMENIARAYIFLALAKDSKTALAGAMINNTHKWAMWENGAWFDGSCHPMYCGTDLRDFGQVVKMEFDSIANRPDTLYGGWWFFAYRIDQVVHHPFPFFVRGDDISFSLMNPFQVVTLNGVVSFQDDFTEKESAQTLYLDLRNHLVQHLVTPGLERSALGTSKVALRFILRSCLRLHYESAEAQLMAWRDVMEGPQFFDENIDMSKRRGDIKALMKDEVWGPMQRTKERRRRSVGRRKVIERLGLITLNGHLVPFWNTFGDRIEVPIGQRGLVYYCLGAAEATFVNTDRTRSYTLKHSKRRFFGIMRQALKQTMDFRRDHDAIRARWRQGYDEMTTKAYWEETLAKPDAA